MAKHNYRLLTGTDLISESYKQMNDNVEALLRGFEGNEFPPNPAKGQRCFCNDKWYTFDGLEWRLDNELHNHDGVYYTKSQSHSKEEIAALLADYRTEYADIKGLPQSFPPCAHEHKMLDITDFPVNLPANGGRADTATRLQTARRIGLSVFDGTKDIALVTPGNWIIVTPIYTGASGSFNAKKHHYATILPAGGTWAYYCLAFGAGVAGGGATVATVTIGSEQTLQQTWNTLCWRIA